ncbi:MAG: hypothetical protein U0525_04300 [Patescibacteria group bacterium]
MDTFSEYANINGLYPYIAFSYDPKNWRIESLYIRVKRWHAHLIGRTEKDRIFVHENRKDLECLDVMRARRLVDETYTGSNVLYDSIK